MFRGPSKREGMVSQLAPDEVRRHIFRGTAAKPFVLLSIGFAHAHF
jgi:hypothetical protein